MERRYQLQRCVKFVELGIGQELIPVALSIPAQVRGQLVELENKAAQLLHSMEDMRVTDTISKRMLGAPLMSGLLQPERKGPQDILSLLEHMICFSETAAADHNGDPEYLLPPLDDVSQLALISHSMVAYLNHLKRSQLVRVTAKIVADTTRWLSHLFRFMDCAASYHNDTTESVLRALKLAIATRCPSYLEKGIASVHNPCLYVAEDSSLFSLQYACRQLGLSLDCIRLVPVTVQAKTNTSMDVSVLQKLIVADLANGRIPLLVLASVGASLLGDVDNVARIYDICKLHSVWLHLRGHSLAALATAQGPGDVSVIITAGFHLLFLGQCRYECS